eukprot:UN01991
MTIQNDQYYIEAPVPTDVALFQTPKRALVHQRYIAGVISGMIGGFLINYLIGLLITKDIVRVPLWHSGIKDYMIGDYKTKIWSTPMAVELLVTGLLGIWLGVPLGSWFIRQDVKKGKAIPIQGNDLSKFRYFGVTIGNMFLRGLYFSIPVMIATYPIYLAILQLACGSGSMKTMEPPSLDGATECYVTRGLYSLIKGFYALFVGLVASPLQELGALNRDNLPEDAFEEYLSVAKKNEELPEAV